MDGRSKRKQNRAMNISAESQGYNKYHKLTHMRAINIKHWVQQDSKAAVIWDQQKRA